MWPHEAAGPAVAGYQSSGHCCLGLATEPGGSAGRIWQGVASIACVRRAACVAGSVGPGACLGHAAACERVEVHINAMLRDRTGKVQLILTKMLDVSLSSFYSQFEFCKSAKTVGFGCF